MKLVFVLLLLFFSFALSSISPTPFLLWSKTNYFAEHNQQYLATVDEFDIECLLKSVLGIQSEKETKFNGLTSQIQQNKPEIVVIFLEPTFTTDQLSQFSSEYHQIVNDINSAFGYLKEAITGKTHSSLSFPYTVLTQEHMSEILLRVVQYLRTVSPDSKIVFSGQGFNSLEGSEERIPNDKLVEHIKTSDLGNDDKTDLIFVSFGPQVAEPEYTTYQDHDRLMNQMEAVIDEKTKGKYLSIFGSDHGSSRVKRSYPPQYWLSETHESQRAPRTVSSSPQYWTTGIYEAIIIMVLLLIIFPHASLVFKFYYGLLWSVTHLQNRSA